MTNLQRGEKAIRGATLRRIWLGLPIAVGGGLAALLGAFALLPQLLEMQAEQGRLAQLEQEKEQLTMLRSQLQATSQRVEKAEEQQRRLFEVVSGNGDLSTFLAMVDREAGLAGVQLDQFEPLSSVAAAGGSGGGGSAAGGSSAAAAASRPPAPPAAAPAPAGGPAAKTVAADDLEIRGLSRQSILLSARGAYPALLDFLRRLERLNVLVVQSNLRLLLEGDEADRRRGPVAAQPGGDGQQPAPLPVLKVLLSLYGRPPAAAAPPGSPGAAAGAPPAAPGSSPPGSSPPAAPAPPAANPASAPAPAPAR
jgi:type IV pilus assembly protein PilO